MSKKNFIKTGVVCFALIFIAGIAILVANQNAPANLTADISITQGDLYFPFDIPGPNSTSTSSVRLYGGAGDKWFRPVGFKEGQNIYAVYDGVVTSIHVNDYGANVIVVDHGGGFTSTYAQIENIQVKKGDAVEKGQIIAYSGKFAKVRDDNAVWGFAFKLEVNGEEIEVSEAQRNIFDIETYPFRDSLSFVEIWYKYLFRELYHT